MHRRSRWIGWVAVGAVVAVGVSGCADEGDPTLPSATATPTSEPSTSTEERVAEARATYQGFLDTAVAMWDLPSVDYTLLLDYANAEIATQEAAGQEELRANGVVDTGSISIAAMESAGGDSADQVDVFACLDFRQSRYIDASGNDVTPDSAVDYAPLQARFERVDDRLLLVAQGALPEGVESPCPQ